MDELLELVRDSNYYEFESVTSVMGYMGSRAERLLEHIRDTKHMYWSIIAKKLKLEAPPQTLEALMAYELEQTSAMSLEARATLVRYGKKMTVSQLICLCCRHSVWHAGQIALTKVD
jgi:uncharacterized damage-inducible protein DinB